jgi:hypothetical protein
MFVLLNEDRMPKGLSDFHGKSQFWKPLPQGAIVCVGALPFLESIASFAGFDERFMRESHAGWIYSNDGYRPPDLWNFNSLTTPSVEIRRVGSGQMQVEFEGRLYSSPNLKDWTLVDPQPQSPYTSSPSTSSAFFRTVRD